MRMPAEYNRARPEWSPIPRDLPAGHGLANRCADKNTLPATLPSRQRTTRKRRGWIAVEPTATTTRRGGRKSRHLPESGDQAVTNRGRPISSFADVHPKDFTIVII